MTRCGAGNLAEGIKGLGIEGWHSPPARASWSPNRHVSCCAIACMFPMHSHVQLRITPAMQTAGATLCRRKTAAKKPSCIGLTERNHPGRRGSCSVRKKKNFNLQASRYHTARLFLMPVFLLCVWFVSYYKTILNRHERLSTIRGVRLALLHQSASNSLSF